MADDRRKNPTGTPSTTGGKMNPSAPTAGTEGPSTNLAGKNPTAQRPGKEGGGNLSFRCADVGFSGCNFEARGNSEEEIRQKAAQHGREKHNITNLDENTRNKIRSSIRRSAA